MDLLVFDWNISAGTLIVACTVAGLALTWWRQGPRGAEAIEAATSAAESLKMLVETRDHELADVRNDAARRFKEVEELRAELADVRVALAKCQEQPKTEELARAITAMQEGFTQANQVQQEAFTRHRDDLLHTQNRILAHLETTTESIKSMEQVLRIVAERLHADSERRFQQESG